MSTSRIQFTWGTPSIDTGRWRLGLYCLYRKPDPHRPGWHHMPRYWTQFFKKSLIVSVRGIALWSLPIALAAHLLAAAALLHWFERQPHNRIGYLDLVLPHRWSDLRPLRGQALIADAYDELAQNRFHAALVKLRAGLAQNPADTQARLDLAGFYALMRLRPAAEKILADGLAHGHPGRPYLQRAHALLAEGDSPENTLAFLHQARALPAPAADLAFIDRQIVRAQLELDRTADALATARALAPPDDALVTTATLQHLLATGARAEAADLARRGLAGSPNSETAHFEAVPVFREADDLPSMRQTLDRMRALAPANPAIPTYAIVQLLQAGQTTDAHARLDDFFFRHGANPRHLELLAVRLVETGDTAAIARVEREARERGFDLKPIRFALLQTQIETHDWTSARATAATLAETPDALRKPEAALLATSTLLVETCLDTGSGIHARLLQAVSANPGGIKLYRLLLDSLLAADRLETAGSILTLAEGHFPASRTLARFRTTWETRTAAQAADSRSSAGDGAGSVSNPPLPPDLPALLAAVERLAAAERYNEALTLIRRGRRHSPETFPAADPRLARWELDLPARGYDLALLQHNLRTHLKNHAITTEAALALAEEWHAREKTNESLLVVRELLKHTPEHPAALATLARWTPKPDPEPPTP